jgi:uncharacterized delta-60 repeat protein
VQPDGKILVAGGFTNLAGVSRNYLGRLNSNGSLDTIFNPSIDGGVTCLALQPDGKILVGGYFTTAEGQARTSFARLNADGTLDSFFNPGVTVNSWTGLYIEALVLQADGKILVGGSFSTLGGYPRANLARLNADGSLDPTFNPAANGSVTSLMIQPDGGVLVGGYFTTLGGQTRAGLARLNSTDTANQPLKVEGSKITWLRSNTCPEVWRTRFDASTNGSTWFSLGIGARISGGWQLAGVSLPSDATIRARGFVTGGYHQGSSWFVERALQLQSRPTIIANGGNFGFSSNRFGFNVSASAGTVVVIEATTDFVQWVRMHTNVVGNLGLFLFQDLNSSLYPRRFYRARFHDGVLPLPLFRSGTAGVQNGQFRFNLDGIAGQTVIIESSTNLLNWSPLATNILGIEPFVFSDSSAINFPCRFYRVRLQ